jgi:hypothetical protein
MSHSRILSATSVAACAALLLGGAPASGQAVVVPFVNGGFQADDTFVSGDPNSLTGFIITENTGFIGTTPGGDANFDSTFLFAGNGVEITIDPTVAPVATAGVEYAIRFDAFGFGDDPEIGFFSMQFLDAAGAIVGTAVDAAIDVPEGATEIDLTTASAIAPTGTARVGFSFFAAGVAVDNFELVVVPEPASAGLLGTAALALLARRRRR